MLRLNSYTLLVLLAVLFLRPWQAQGQINKVNVKKAEEYMRYGEYRSAIPIWQDMLKNNPDDRNANFQLGICYLQAGLGAQAYSHLQKAKDSYDNLPPRFYLLLAQSQHMAGKWTDAIENYEGFIETMSKDDPSERTEVEKRIKQCRAGMVYEANATHAVIENMGPTVNTRFPEYTPVITADNSTMYFTSRRDGSTGGEKTNTDEYYEDIYSTTRRGKTDWSMPLNLGGPVNGETHDAAIAISPDGSQLFLYKDVGEGDIYTSTRKGRTWTKPTSIGKSINTKGYREPSVSITADGKTLFFSSDRPDGLGGLDIYMCRREGNDWGPPVNLGSAINTAEDDDSPFIHPDGVTLYYSSKGHETMGGYDIFRTVLEEGNWTVPENLGWPINTPGNDIYFVLSADSKTGYYASERPGGLGYTDLYRITIHPMDSVAEEQTKAVASIKPDSAGATTHSLKPVVRAVSTPVRSAAPVLLVKGIVSDALTKMPIGAKIQVVDNATGEVASEVESNSATGEYLVVLPKNKNYGMTVTAPEYLFHSENFYLPDNKEYAEFNKDVAMNKATAGTRVVLRNIFFDTNKSTLRKESKSELEKLLRLMKEMPTLKLEISGHTDNVGSALHNRKLSEERAESVVKFLTEKGVAKDRLTFEGYGFDRPIAPNDNEGNRQLNRRTEFEVK